MSADLLALMDQLEEAHEASKLGGWPALEFRVMTAPDALPKLTAALRAVLMVAAEFDTAYMECRSDEGHLIATRIRAAITAALAPEPVQS